MASSDAKAALIQKHEVGLNRPKEIADYELQRFGIRDVQRILDCLHTLRARAHESVRTGHFSDNENFRTFKI
jgi:spore cortex formation protein SpoVR/YcgB (stage V sporulation)